MLQAYQELANATSQLVQANEELERANQQLVQLNREKNEFIGIAAHDLKNPLTAVLGYSEILSMQQQPNRENNALFGEKIKIAAERMLHLITNLLDINAIEEGRMGLKMERGRSRQRDHSDDGRPATGRGAHKSITIHLALPRNRLCHGRFPRDAADRGKFPLQRDQIFARGAECLHQSRAHEGVTMEVQDEGPGLSEEDQARLFQKYSRLTPQPTGGESSTGLGLSIVKRLAESMGGSVGCRSQLGRGTVFWVSLRGYCSAAAA